MSMTAFPMDSQVTETGEDGLPVYDRAFSSNDLREVMKAYFGNGYFAEDGTSLNVKAGDGLNVIVQAGKANIQGTLGFMDEDETLRLDNPDKTNPRIDTVVARLDLSLDKRCIELDVIHGTAAASPVAPQLTRSESVYELGLADVTVPANAAAVSAENIKDTRLDADRCGVAEPFAKLDTTTLFEQVTAIINKTSEDATAQVGKLEKATTDAVSAMNDALSSTVLGSVWRLQSTSTSDYLAYGDDLNGITGVGSKFCESAAVAGGIQNKPAEVTGAFALYTFATETDPSRLGQMLLTVGGDGVMEFTRAGAGSSWSAWEKVGAGTKLGTVTAVGSDYTLTATVGGEAVTMPYTTACERAAVGDSVLVSQVAGTSYATDVLATSDNSPYVLLYDTAKQPGAAPSSVSGTGNLNDYARLKVYGSTGEWKRCYIELYKPLNGYNAVEFSMDAYNGSGSNAWVKMSSFKVTQTGSSAWSIKPTAVSEVHFAASGATLSTSYGPSIVRVVGVREPSLAVG